MRMQNDPATMVKRLALVLALLLIGVSLTLGYGLGYWHGQRHNPTPLDSERQDVLGLRTDTQQVLEQTIGQLRAEARITCYSYTGIGRVSFKREYMGLVGGKQELHAPYIASYFLDFAEPDSLHAKYLPAQNRIVVTLPKLQVQVQFDPRKTQAFHSGVLTLNRETVQDLTKLNYETARQAAVQHAQSPALTELAQTAARNNIRRLFHMPLSLVGQGDIPIDIRFPHESSAQPAQ